MNMFHSIFVLILVNSNVSRYEFWKKLQGLIRPLLLIERLILLKDGNKKRALNSRC